MLVLREGKANSVERNQTHDLVTLQGTITYPIPAGTFESMIFLFPFGGICDRSREGMCPVMFSFQSASLDARPKSDFSCRLLPLDTKTMKIEGFQPPIYG